jgi:hypothetical protein
MTAPTQARRCDDREKMGLMSMMPADSTSLPVEFECELGTLACSRAATETIPHFC